MAERWPGLYKAQHSPPFQSKTKQNKRQAGVSPPVCVEETVTPYLNGHKALTALAHPLHAPYIFVAVGEAEHGARSRAREE